MAREFFLKRIAQYNEDWFKCSNCGYTVRYKVLGDTAKCSQCGGRMDRVK